MSLKLTANLTLRGRVLSVLLPGLLFIIGAELWLTRMDAIDAANAAFDRSLLGAIKSVELNTSTASGGLSIELPYRLFEFFQLTANGTVYFRVASADGLVEIGTPDLPQPAQALVLGVPVFHDASYLGEDLRVGTYLRDLPATAEAGRSQRLVIQVAETVQSRRAFISSFVLRTAVRDALVVTIIGLTIAAMLTWLLRPVSKLAAHVTSRDASDMRPLERKGLPRDIQPLVDAINQQLARSKDLMERQRQFLDDASHQLRTPLATLHTQVGYALRAQSLDSIVLALKSVSQQLEHATRTTNQLLALARTDASLPTFERFDLGDMVREVATYLLPLASRRRLDFGVDVAAGALHVVGDRRLLTEALTNLAHNAVLYAAQQGLVTLRARSDAAQATLEVLNEGAPIPDSVLQHAGERFVRGHGSGGSGLGLAIAKSIAERHGGGLQMLRLTDNATTCVRLQWPQPETEA